MRSFIRRSLLPWRAIAISVIFLAVMITTTFLFVSATDRVYADSSGHLITIHDGGTEKVVITSASTIGDALKEAKISVGSKDLVEPAVTESIIAPEYQVNIYRARPVTIIDGNIRQTIFTAYQTTGQITKSANITLFPEDEAVFSRISDISQGFGEMLTIVRATPVNFTIYGKTSVVRTQSQTIGEMLVEKGIQMGDSDKILPDTNSLVSSDMNIKLWREGKQTVSVEEEVAFSIETIEDANRDYNYHETKSAGEKGLRTVTYEILIEDSREVSRKEIASVIIKQPTKQTEMIGVMGKYTTPSENETITWNFLMAQGFNRTQTAGIMGNLMQEHGFQTSDTPGGLGIVQWTAGRRANLMSHANWDNIYVQLDFLMEELNGGYIGVKSQLLSATSLTQAVQIFQNQFERCGICLEGKRITYAQNILASH